MSSWVMTQPPPAIALLAMAIDRPSDTSTMAVAVSPGASPSSIWVRSLSGSRSSWLRSALCSSSSCTVQPGFTAARALHLDIAVVADGHPLLGVEHEQALEHVLQRRIEALVLRR